MPIIYFLFSSLLWAQEPQDKSITLPVPTIQELWDKNDVLLLKETLSIGSIVGSNLISVEKVQVTQGNTKADGISLVVDKEEQYLFSVNELTLLIKQLEALLSKMNDPMPPRGIYTISTRNGIRIIYSPKGMTPTISLNNIQLTRRQFDDLRKLLEKALAPSSF